MDYKIRQTVSEGIPVYVSQICAYCKHFKTNGEPFGICAKRFVESLDENWECVQMAVDACVGENFGCRDWELEE